MGREKEGREGKREGRLILRGGLVIVRPWGWVGDVCGGVCSSCACCVDEGGKEMDRQDELRMWRRGSNAERRNV